MNRKIKNSYLSILIRILIFTVVIMCLYFFIFSFTRTESTDMNPHIHYGDLVIGYRLDNNYERGDVVVLKDNLVLRVVAVPGDVVIIDESGNLIINGSNAGLNDYYPTYPADDGISYPYRVPGDSVFVLGDYRTKAADSRMSGAVVFEDIKAKAVMILRRRDL